MLNICPDAPFITLLDDYDEEDGEYFEPMPGDPYDFIGISLHQIQQGQAEELCINGYKVSAILMDQTGGSIMDPDDIVRTDHPDYPYQRLGNVIHNDFRI